MFLYEPEFMYMVDVYLRRDPARVGEEDGPPVINIYDSLVIYLCMIEIQYEIL